MADQVDDEEEWQTEDFCIRLLCEHEEVNTSIYHITKYCFFFFFFKITTLYMFNEMKIHATL